MARYLSKYSRFKKTARKGEQVLTSSPSGPQMQLVREPIIAMFQQSTVTAAERDEAKHYFGFRGVADGEDDLGRRVSGFDTDEQAKSHAWDDETKTEVERVLDAGVGVDYFRVEKVRLPAPWPRYDEMVVHGRRTVEVCAEKIKDTVFMLGLDPQEVAAYERENLNRPEVLEALATEEELEEAENTEILVDA